MDVLNDREEERGGSGQGVLLAWYRHDSIFSLWRCWFVLWLKSVFCDRLLVEGSLRRKNQPQIFQLFPGL